MQPWSPHCLGFDEVVIGEERWYTLAGQPTRKFVPNQDQPFRYMLPIIDPRTAVFCLTSGIVKGYSTERLKWDYVRPGNVVKASRKPNGLWMVIEAGPPTGNKRWLHIFFDRTQGENPTMMAMTNAETKLAEEQGNAIALNRVRWKEASKGVWLPESFQSTNYPHGGTKGDHEYLLSLDIRCVWIDQEMLPKDVFDTEALDSAPGAVLAEMDRWLTLVQELPHVWESRRKPAR